MECRVAKKNIPTSVGTGEGWVPLCAAHMRSRFFPATSAPVCHCQHDTDTLWRACVEAGRHARDTQPVYVASQKKTYR